MATMQPPPEHCDLCLKAIETADSAIPFGEQCLECDLPVGPYLDALKAAKESALKQLRVFHPDKVPPTK